MLINGCSFSRGPDSWPYHLGCNIVNLAQAGAGNTYIHESTVTELSKRKYDAVTIMWTSPQRLDLRVDDISVFSESKYTSFYQKLQNDWPEKVVCPVNDQDYVDPNWVFGCGHINGEKALKNLRAFDSIYKFQSQDQFNQAFLIKLISTQNTLKQLNIPHLCTFYHPYFDGLKDYDLFKLVDMSSIYNDKNILDIMKLNNWYDVDGIHPGKQAHQAWANIIKQVWENKLAQELVINNKE